MSRDNGVTAAVDASLEPVRAAMLAQTRTQADRLLAAADEDGRRAVAEARRQADRLLADARASGLADATARTALEISHARRAGRRAVLQARSAIYQQVWDRAQAAVRELLTDPQRRDALETIVRTRLGDDADTGRVLVAATTDGGMTGIGPDGRTMDASVRSLVAAALADFDLEQLWAP